MGKIELVFQERESGQKPQNCSRVMIDPDTRKEIFVLKGEAVMSYLG